VDSHVIGIVWSTIHVAMYYANDEEEVPYLTLANNVKALKG